MILLSDYEQPAKVIWTQIHHRPQLLFEVVGEKFSARLEADEAVQLLNLPACELIQTREQLFAS